MNKKNTIKSMVKMFKDSRHQLGVITFDMSGRRLSSYGGLSITGALGEMSRRTAQAAPIQVLIVNDKTAPCAKDHISDYTPHIWDFTDDK
jgi:hypothetical protein